LHIDAGLVLDNFRKMAADKRGPVPQKPESLPEGDRMLIRLLLLNEDARAEFIPELKELGILQDSPAKRIYEALFAMSDAGAHVQFGDLHARLDETSQKILAAALIGNDTGDAVITMEHGRSCLEGLREKAGRAKMSEIKSRIREAERSGNIAEALRLADLLKR
jgi:hypothetical protein